MSRSSNTSGVLLAIAVGSGGVAVFASSLSHWWLAVYVAVAVAFVIVRSHRHIEHAKSLGRAQAFDGAERFVEGLIRLREHGD